MSAGDMTCRQMVELVTGYLEDRLPEAERRRFEAHLALCEGCQAYLAQMRALIEELGTLPEVQLSPAIEEDLLTAFRDWRAGRS
ncbi:MAG TPA: zf-HC2 domain-containing protein [Miltoncostaeaceae bacterium]|jgi:anti-sigma factor RsiW|nr:zf-HC2 domain-containing protein [Miltoncostaeaceae bacterium]